MGFKENTMNITSLKQAQLVALKRVRDVNTMNIFIVFPLEATVFLKELSYNKESHFKVTNPFVKSVSLYFCISSCFCAPVPMTAAGEGWSRETNL